MNNSSGIFTTEYRYQYTGENQKRTLLLRPTDCFAERIEDWQIDPRFASAATNIDDAAKNLVRKLLLDNIQTVYQVCYKNPHSSSSKGSKKDESNFESELTSYLRDLYFNPHTEKILAPPFTTKRVFGYTRPKFLHMGLSCYQDTYGRTGGQIILQNAERTTATK